MGNEARKWGEAQFSFFAAPVTNKVPRREPMTLLECHRFITQSERARAATLALRRAATPEERRRIKAATMDYAMFSGTFAYGSDQRILRHSSMLCLDFDHVAASPEEVEQVKRRLMQDDKVESLMAFRSPSGDGVKWVVGIDLTLCCHNTWFAALSTYALTTYGIAADRQCANVSRACFLPHDPHALVCWERM